jgi:hypothetical protein
MIGCRKSWMLLKTILNAQYSEKECKIIIVKFKKVHCISEIERKTTE